MNNYRICKNAYGYYKVQKWHKPFKLFGMTLFKGSWEDCGFKGFSCDCVKFNTKEEALELINELIGRDLRKNDSWVCSDNEVES